MQIQETSFGPKRYLTLRKSIATSQITDKQMYHAASKKLGAYIQQNGLRISGPWSVVYFSWDEANGKAEIGISFPIDGLGEVNDPELIAINIPRSSAAMDTLHGSYDGLGATHQSLMKYIAEKKYDMSGLSAMAIEEYAADPMSDPDPKNWVTNIYYLHN